MLVVDDDPAVREIAVSSLESLGYRMPAAANGPAALDVLARDQTVDLLVVDVAMSGMNGVEFIRRARERRSGLPAVLVTGYADVAALSPAGNLVFQKPHRPERLADGTAGALRSERRKPRSNVVAVKPSSRRA
jgi:CheY-like chemotaxis protein